MDAEIKIRNLKDDDAYDLFEWRNHPDVRKRSFNVDCISWEEHEKWFNIKIKDKKTVIYIVCLKDEKLGSIRFDRSDECIKVSVVLSPDFWGKGFGSEVIRLGTAKFIKDKKPKVPIIAEVKTENVASLKSFMKANYKEECIVLVYND